MAKAAGQVLKANNVSVKGQYHLDAGQSARPASPRPVAPAASGPQVRVAEACPEYAVVEVTCPCGEKTLVKCLFNEAGV